MIWFLWMLVKLLLKICDRLVVRKIEEMKDTNNVTQHVEDKPYDAWVIVALVIIAFVCICLMGK